jgi:hypothetical protein
MDLLSIDHINEQYLFYEDLKSTRKWLNAKKINVIKMGKRYYVAKEDMDNIIREMLNKVNIISTKEKTSKTKTNTIEHHIGMELLHKIKV